jgi:hypothetical protein
MRPSLALSLLIILVGVAASARAAISFSISFDDPTTGYTAYYSAIRSNLLAAAELWARNLGGSASLELQVKFDPTSVRASGRSAASSFVTNIGGINVFEQGMAAELRTGSDPNGVAPDGEIFLEPNYLVNELWFDPDPVSRSAVVQANEIDAVSVFLHELGHAFAFNGFKDSLNGTLPGDYESTFDRYTTFDGTNLYFNGPVSASIYGTPIPLTYGNNFHLGNASPRPGSNLIPDMMNGVVFNRGVRYTISALDLAVLQDSGLVIVPEPGGAPLLVGAFLFLMMTRIRPGMNSAPSSRL